MVDLRAGASNILASALWLHSKCVIGEVATSSSTVSEGLPSHNADPMFLSGMECLTQTMVSREAACQVNPDAVERCWLGHESVLRPQPRTPLKA